LAVVAQGQPLAGRSDLIDAAAADLAEVSRRVTPMLS
jgi:hypothetical protein